MPAPASRVLFLGLDGGSMTVLGPAFERGWMPNLAALWRRAASGTMRASTPMVTPVAWSSFLTGCTPQVHGIHEFDYLEAADHTIRHNDATRIRVPTLWDVLDARVGPVVSLGLPMTHAGSNLRGRIVGGSDSTCRAAAFAQCPDFGDELAAEVPAYTHKLAWKSRPRTLDELQSDADWTCSIFRAQAEAAVRADGLCDWSAMMVHFHNLDSLQHRLWPYLNVDETGLDDPEWASHVVNCLRALDEAAGRLLELASRRDAAVIAVSDHGFGPCKALVNVNGLLAGAGLLRPLAYGTRFRYRARRLGDRLRRWRVKKAGGCDADRLPRSVAGEVGCDWKRTVAFAPFGQLSGCIFLNGRTVRGEAAAERAIDDVIAACRAARDPETAEPLFADVFSTADRYGLDPAAAGIPDVLALSADGYQAQAKWSPFCRALMKHDPNLPATHWSAGIVAIDAPDVRPGRHLVADLQDVAPTALGLLGHRVPSFMEGRLLHEAFEEPLAADARGNGVAAHPRPFLRAEALR